MFLRRHLAVSFKLNAHTLCLSDFTPRNYICLEILAQELCIMGHSSDPSLWEAEDQGWDWEWEARLSYSNIWHTRHWHECPKAHLQDVHWVLRSFSQSSENNVVRVQWTVHYTRWHTWGFSLRVYSKNVAGSSNNTAIITRQYESSQCRTFPFPRALWDLCFCSWGSSSSLLSSTLGCEWASH